MISTRTLHIGITVAAVGLFVESLHVIGFQQVVEGVSRIGWGFVLILGLSIARDVVRAAAWALSVDRSVRLPIGAALRARLAGEALNSLLPIGMVAGEPTKASHVSGLIGFGRAAKGLAVEFAFYTASLMVLIATGVAAFAAVKGARMIVGVAAITVSIAGAWLFMRRSQRLLAADVDRIGTIVSLEVAYQLFAIAEVYCALAFVAPAAATLTAAIVLETVSRGVTMVFKVIPLRVGVDEVSSSFVAGSLALNPATGLTVALIRRLRLLFWSAVGLLLLMRRPAAAHSHAPLRTSHVVSAG